ncbi:hypothetical protein HMPREF9534_05090 [Escherichia coli MS 69-1]|nr:hypothetical protein HMPREF9534_05090 [Escherichia coli MS 69-1]
MDNLLSEEALFSHTCAEQIEIFSNHLTWWEEINILRHSRRVFKCAYKALLPAAP